MNNVLFPSSVWFSEIENFDLPEFVNFKFNSFFNDKNFKFLEPKFFKVFGKKLDFSPQQNIVFCDFLKPQSIGASIENLYFYQENLSNILDITKIFQICVFHFLFEKDILHKNGFGNFFWALGLDKKVYQIVIWVEYSNNKNYYNLTFYEYHPQYSLEVIGRRFFFYKQ